jgi:hypothetical protein
MCTEAGDDGNCTIKKKIVKYGRTRRIEKFWKIFARLKSDQGNPREQELLNCDHFKESWTKKKQKQTFFFSSRKPIEEIIPTV